MFKKLYPTLVFYSYEEQVFFFFFKLMIKIFVELVFTDHNQKKQKEQ